MAVDAKSILKSKNLRITNCRLEVVQHFIDNQSGAFCQRELETLSEAYDRVTIYRTLISLLNAGIVHKIPNETGVANYALSHVYEDSEKHFDQHIHFKCEQCGKIECLEDHKVPEVAIPTGYKLSKVNLIVDGVCLQCGK